MALYTYDEKNLNPKIEGVKSFKLVTGDGRVIWPTKPPSSFVLNYSRKSVKTDYNSCAYGWFIFQIGNNYYEADEIQNEEIAGNICSWSVTKVGNFYNYSYTFAQALKNCRKESPSSLGVLMNEMPDNTTGTLTLKLPPDTIVWFLNTDYRESDMTSGWSPFMQVKYKDFNKILVDRDTHDPSDYSVFFGIDPNSNKVKTKTFDEFMTIRDSAYWIEAKV